MLSVSVAITSDRAVSRLLPAAVLDNCASTRSSLPACQIHRSRFARYGLSLACPGFPSPGYPAKVSDPGLLLRNFCLRFCLTRSVASSWLPFLRGADQYLLPVVKLPCLQFLNLFHPCSPSGLSSLRFMDLAAREPLLIRIRIEWSTFSLACHSATPDLPSLPDSRSWESSIGSSFRVRYVPSGSLFRVPLGTIRSMYQTGNEVKRNL